MLGPYVDSYAPTTPGPTIETASSQALQPKTPSVQSTRAASDSSRFRSPRGSLHRCSPYRVVRGDARPVETSRREAMVRGELARTGVVVGVGPDESILDAARRHVPLG